MPDDSNCVSPCRIAVRLGAVGLFAATLIAAVPAAAQYMPGPAGFAQPAYPTFSVAAVQGALVPANFTQVMDSQGFRWDVGPAGHIIDGTGDCFDNAEQLSVNGMDFHPQQAMMTPDGTEYVFSGAAMNLQVTRRVKIDIKAAAVRYVEVLHNPGSGAVQASITLMTQFGNSRAQTVMTDSGTPVPASYSGGHPGGGFTLGKKDTGFVAFAPMGVSQPSVVFHLAGPRSKVQATVFSDQHFRYTVNYTVSVPPRRSVAVLHGTAQRRLPSLDANSAAALLKPFNERSWIRDLPGDVKRALANRGGGVFGGLDDVISLASLESLGVEPGPSDVLAIGEHTRLSGSATGRSVSMETPYGEIMIPFEELAAVAGRRHTGGPPRLFLRDGQVFSGNLSLKDVRFTMHSGLAVELAAESLDRLIVHATPEEADLPEEVTAMLETVGGDRLALVRSPGSSVRAWTPWGEREIPMDEVRLLYAAQGELGHRLLLRDGSRLFAFLDNRPIEVTALSFGPQELAPSSIHSVTAVEKKRSEGSEASELGSPHMLLAGGSLLVGRIELPSVHFVVAGQSIPVPPDQIREMRNLLEGPAAAEREGPLFEALLWDGGTLAGTLQERTLPVRTRDGLCRVLAGDIVESRVPCPTVPDHLRTRIADLIRDLGHPEYGRRKAAAAGLKEMGHLPKLQLEEARRQSTDPEVRRSVEALLEALKD